MTRLLTTIWNKHFTVGCSHLDIHYIYRLGNKKWHIHIVNVFIISLKSIQNSVARNKKRVSGKKIMHLLVNHTIYVVDEYFISRQRDNNKYYSIKVIGNRYLLQVFSLFHAVELHIRNAIWWLSGNHYMNQKYPQDIHLFCYGWKVVYQIQFLESYHMNKYHNKRIVCGVYTVMIGNFELLIRIIWVFLIFFNISNIAYVFPISMWWKYTNPLTK